MRYSDTSPGRVRSGYTFLPLAPDINVTNLVISLLVLIFSLSVHEAAHAWSASQLGDDTAKRLGRVTLNPIAHTDPIGTLLLPIVAMASGAPLIGWAKPTPVNTRNLRHPGRDHILVLAAGPVSNLLIAMTAAAAMRAGAMGRGNLLDDLVYDAVTLNVLLAVFNMLPIPPLDGGQIVMGLLPRTVAAQLGFLYQYGFLILMGLLVAGVLGSLIARPYYLILSWLM